MKKRYYNEVEAEVNRVPGVGGALAVTPLQLFAHTHPQVLQAVTIQYSIKSLRFLSSKSMLLSTHHYPLLSTPPGPRAT